MADRIVKPDTGNDLVLQNDDGSAKIEINEDGSMPVTGTLEGSMTVGSGKTLDVSSGTFTTSSAQKQAIVQAGPGSGTLDVSSGTFTTSSAQKQAIVQAGPGSGTLDVSSGTFTTSTAQKQAIVDGADIEGTAILSTGESGGTKFLREDGDGSCSWQTADAVPTGMIAPFGMSSAPSGYLVCDGSAVSRTTYSALFSAISTTWGTGDGSSTFNIPDLRGQFLRGLDNGAGNDPDASSRTGGDAVGSSQSFAMEEVTGSFNEQNMFIYTRTGVFSDGPSASHFLGANSNVSTSTVTTNFSLDDGGAQTSTETRPINKNVQYCIKY